MSWTGHIIDGGVVLDSPANLPNGTPVIVQSNVPMLTQTDSGPTLLERMKDLVGIAEGLPADAALNVDHYLYGHPKR